MRCTDAVGDAGATVASRALGVDMCVTAVLKDSDDPGGAGSAAVDAAGVGAGSGGQYVGGPTSAMGSGVRSGNPAATPAAMLDASRKVDDTAVTATPDMTDPAASAAPSIETRHWSCISRT